MPNLEKLRKRLEQLPEKRSLRVFAESFGKHTQNLAKSRRKLEQARKDMEHASKVDGNPEYKEKVLPLLKSSVKIANKLYNEIEKEPHKIKTKATDNKIIKINERSSAANTKCCKIWEREIEKSVTKWEKISSVVQELGARGGEEFKRAVDNLKIQDIPKNDHDVDKVRSYKDNLQKGVANLGLEGPFGEFLTGAAEGCASPRDLLKKEIREKMDEHELWDSFRVLLKR